MKIVIDTNVFVSAVFFGGKPLDVIRTVISKENEAYVSPEIWDEYADVIERLGRKYPKNKRTDLLQQMLKIFKIVSPSHSVDICRDKDDNKFISCALESKCMFIVSGDDDLLSLKQVEDVRIVTAAEFLLIR